MKLNEIKMMLHNGASISEFKREIFHEVSAYKKGHLNKKDIIPINLIEDTELYFGKADLQLLCNYFLVDALTSWELAYIMDGILLSSRVIFENDVILSFSEELTDPEINGKVTKESINNILHELQ